MGLGRRDRKVIFCLCYIRVSILFVFRFFVFEKVGFRRRCYLGFFVVFGRVC